MYRRYPVLLRTRLLLCGATLLFVHGTSAAVSAAAQNTVANASFSTTATSLMPMRGLTMSEVIDAYGAPLKRLPAVGSPPIVRWIYTNYTVYFEDRFVIHSVVHHKPPH